MEKEEEEIENNIFLTRGCCHPPKIFDKSARTFKHGCSKLDTFNWLKNIPESNTKASFDCVEVRLKNSHKEFYRLPPDLEVEQGDIVAIESNPGHDIGIVDLTGEIVKLQMKKKNVRFDSPEIKKLYRKARLNDIEKWVSSVEKENYTLEKTRRISYDLKLKMKFNDIEYQGVGTKATFYYSADERVDFRELIRVLADEFKVRVEMKQIGVRQEAGRIGGLGSCGRELCCATWLNNFQTVSTHAARVQQLSLNPQKLAGQCSKLKCCLNYEQETYVDALKEFPNTDLKLRTKAGDAFHQKTDIFRKLMWYSYTSAPNNLFAIPLNKVKEIIQANLKNTIIEKLEDYAQISEKKNEFEAYETDIDDLKRFE